MVVGQGFVGLPEAIDFVGAGFNVVGLEQDPRRVKELSSGLSPSPDVSTEELAAAYASRRYQIANDPGALSAAAVVVVCVGTPLDDTREPDLSALTSACAQIATHVSSPALIIIESTVPPGTTRQIVLPLLEQSGRKVGREVFLGFAPERIDPGNRHFLRANTPRLVSGITPECTSLTEALYQQTVHSVKVVSAPEVAELAKALENTFRYVNISLVNELAVLSDRLGYSVWEVLDAASTKPFAFLRHEPGPGVGGSCIPVVPQFLRHAAKQSDVSSPIIDAANEINATMPRFVVLKLSRILRQRGIDIRQARILVIGISYKPDIADSRESPALPVLQALGAAGAHLAYHDPMLPSLTIGDITLTSVPCDDKALRQADCVVILTLHSSLDPEHLIRHSRLIFDTRNALRAPDATNVVVL